MTRDEAIKELETIKMCEVDTVRQVQALDVALSALCPTSQERVENVWRGEWIIPTIIGGKAYNIPHCSACNGVPCGTDEHTRFCAHCGAPMTDEAVQILLKRLEALKDGKGD